MPVSDPVFSASVRIRFITSKFDRASPFNRASKRIASTGAPAPTRGVIASLNIAIRCCQQPAVRSIRNRCMATFEEIG